MRPLAPLFDFPQPSCRPSRPHPCPQLDRSHPLITLTLISAPPLVARMTDSARNSTSSWLGSLAQPPPSSSPVGLHSKFSTIALGNGQGARRTRAGLGFFEDGSALEGSIRPSFAEEESRREDQSGWSVTLAESPKSRSRSKKVSGTLPDESTQSDRLLTGCSA